MIEPLVSIIINNFNYGRYVSQAIESVLAQTYKNIELIIVDDGSTDESIDIICKYTNHAQVIFKENGGQASALNIGIAKAMGSYILLLDSDDYLFPEAIEVCVKLFPQGYSRVFYRFEFVDGNDKIIPPKKSIDSFRIFDGDVLKELTKRGIFPAQPTSGNLFDAKKIKAVIPIPEKKYKICADLYLFVKTSLYGPVCSIDRKLAAYRIHGENNFIAGSGCLDNRRLKNQLNNYYMSIHILEETCKQAGYDYKHKVFEKSFIAMNTLCMAYKMNLDKPYILILNKWKLFKIIIEFLRLGNQHVGKKTLQAIYLSFSVILPRVIAIKLFRLMYSWLNR
jgi:glycosyltransferase involved in cell wall biosynthesis